MPAPPLPVEPVTALPYADLPAQFGVQHATHAGGVTIVLPPPPWWKRGEVIAPLMLIPFVVLPQFLQALSRGRTMQVTFAAALAVAMVIGSILATRHRRRVVLEVTADTLRLENIRPLWTTDGPSAPVRTLIYQRRDVYDIRFVEHSGNVVVRIHGREMVEFLPAVDRRLNRWIGEQLRVALGLPA